MDKIFFWVTVVIVAVIGIWGLKALAGAVGPQGFKDFMSGI